MDDSGVQFHEEGPQFRRKEFYDQKPGFGAKLANLIMKISGGLIKTEKQAYFIILALVGVIIIISLFLFFGGGSAKPIYKEETAPPGSLRIQP